MPSTDVGLAVGHGGGVVVGCFGVVGWTFVEFQGTGLGAFGNYMLVRVVLGPEVVAAVAVIVVGIVAVVVVVVSGVVVVVSGVEVDKELVVEVVLVEERAEVIAVGDKWVVEYYCCYYCYDCFVGSTFYFVGRVL